MMTFNAEYPTKDWLKSSPNAWPIDIIREKPLTDFNFAPINWSYCILKKKMECINQDLNLLPSKSFYTCQNGG